MPSIFPPAHVFVHFVVYTKELRFLPDHQSDPRGVLVRGV